MGNWSSIYLLPSNAKSNFDSRVGDERTGMLSYCDDGTNYGLLELLKNDGTFCIPMASIKTETIWSGSVTGYANVVLTVDVNDYKLFIVTYNSTYTTVTKADLSLLTGVITRIIGVY